MSPQEKKYNYRFRPNKYPLESGNRLIEASAGTGKTFSLAHIILRLITEKRIPIKEILVVTFTEAAASELKSRIVNRLEECLRGLDLLNNDKKTIVGDDVIKEWLEIHGKSLKNRQYYAGLLLEALDAIDQSDITTIHGFCKRTLDTESLNAYRLSKPIIEEESKPIIQEVVHDYWKDQILSLKAEDVKGLIGAGINIDTIINCVLKIDNDPNLELRLEQLDVENISGLREQFENFLSKNWKNFLICWLRDGRELFDMLKSIASHWRQQGNKNTKPFSSKPRNNYYEKVDSWITKYSADEKYNSVPSFNEIRQQKLLSSYFHPAAFYEASSRCGESNNVSLPKPYLQKSIANIWDGPAEFVLKHSIYWTIRALHDRRRKNNVMSYGDLLKELDPGITGLNEQIKKERTSTPLTAQLRLRYKVALIDEFQDTDPLQWRILQQTFGESSHHYLLMVGDPKQAIYSFRGGDLNTYLNACKYADRIDLLVDNFRTTAPLMKELNHFMGCGLIRSKLEVLALNPKTNEPALSLKKNQSFLEVFNLEDENEKDPHNLESKSAKEKKIPEAVANAVLEILRDEDNEIKPSDICILVNRHDQATAISRGLADSNLPSRLVTQGDVLKTEGASILQIFIDCIANPGDSGKLKLVASSALLQWSTNKLEEAENRGHLDQLANKFRGWSKNIKTIGIMACLMDLIEAETMADLSKRNRILPDLQQSTQLLEEEIHKQGLDAEQAAKWLNRERLSLHPTSLEKRQPNSDLVDSCINVITVHRSKGLEFRIVICPYLWQAPLMNKGIIYDNKKENRSFLSLNKNWGEAKIAYEQAQEDQLQEAERIAYVALTRARSRILILWTRSAKQEGSPLVPLLFGPKSIDLSMAELTSKRMHEWFNSIDMPIVIKTAKPKATQSKWCPKTPSGELTLGPIPTRVLDKSWGRSSYSTWTAKSNSNNPSYISSEFEIGDGKDTDQNENQPLQSEDRHKTDTTNNDLLLATPWSRNGPLSQFPRGAEAGECLHKILERIDFTKPISDTKSSKVISQELLNSGFDIKLETIVMEGLDRVLQVPLGEKLKGLQLKELHSKRKLNEVAFDIPLAHKGNAIKSVDIARVFSNTSKSRFQSSYSEHLNRLKVNTRGFLTGSIDLVFSDQEDTSKAKWWVLDWKSNWTGVNNANEEEQYCGPIHYDQEAMEKQMIIHHYPLQAHIYLVALHRLLEWRLPKYSPDQHLGGYIYLFLRGIPSEKEIKKRALSEEIPGIILEEAPVDRVLALNRLFEKGGI